MRMYWKFCADTNIIRRTHKIALPQMKTVQNGISVFVFVFFFPSPVVCEVSKSEHTWIVRHSMFFFREKKTKPF